MSPPPPGRRVWLPVDLLAVGVIVADIEGSASFANSSWSTLTGQSGSMWSGLGWLAALDEDDRDSTRAALLREITIGERYEAEWSINVSGEPRTLTVVAMPDVAARAVRGFVITAIPSVPTGPDTAATTVGPDPLGTRANDDRAPPSDGEGIDLLAAAAHELRTPLTTIAGYTTTLREHHLTMSAASVNAGLIVLERQTTRLADLLADLLDLGRWRHTVRRDLQPVRLADALADALEAAPPPEGVAVIVRAGSPDVMALGDRAALARVLVNLLTNSYRYGGAELTVEIEGSDSADISVIDDGPGIAPELLPLLFMPFGALRADAASSGAPGAGLGLALARQIVESCGGQLSHSPAEPHGTRMTVSLPRPVVS